MNQPPKSKTLLLALLPVWLLGGMVLIALPLEILLYDTLLWPGKLLLIGLILWPLLRRRRLR